MKHRVLSMVLAACLLFSIAPPSAEGKSDVVEISDAAGLAAIADDLSGHYELTADIELEAAWTPITDLAGGDAPVFTGVLDGGGHTVSNLYMEQDAEYASLIGDIAQGAEIRSLRVEVGAQGVSSTYDASGLISYMTGGLIENCCVLGDVVNTDPQDCYAGALVAYMFDGTVSGCYSTGNVSGGGAGGLIGYIEGGSVKNSYSLAKVSGVTSAGGFAGSAEDCAISACYAAGEVSVSDTQAKAGGFLGERYDGGALTSCFYQYEDVSAQKPDGIGSDEAFFESSVPEGLAESALTFGAPLSGDWDMDVWYFSAGEYPRLQWAKGQTEEPLAPPAPSDIKYTESEELGTYSIQFPAADEAVAYQIEIYDQSPAQAGYDHFALPAECKAALFRPIYSGFRDEVSNRPTR